MLTTKSVGKLSAMKLSSLIGQKAFGSKAAVGNISNYAARHGNGFSPKMVLIKPSPFISVRGFIIKNPNAKEPIAAPEDFLDEPRVPILGPILTASYYVAPETARTRVELIKTAEVKPVVNIVQAEVPAGHWQEHYEVAGKKKESSIWWGRIVCMTCFGTFIAITGCLTSMLEAADDSKFGNTGIPTGHLVGIMFR